MKKRINLVVTLMALCTVFLLGLQLYWNYQAYQNSIKTFKSETNDALDKAVERVTKIRMDEMAAQFKTWLADTNLVVITCKYNFKAKQTVFSLSDKYPSDRRLPVSMSFEGFNEHLDKITPAAKTYFVDHFVQSSVYNFLKSASIYFLPKGWEICWERYIRKISSICRGLIQFIKTSF